MLRNTSRAVICASALALAANATAQRSISIRIVSPQQEIHDYCAAGEYTHALAVIERELARSSNDPILLYNAACVSARLGEIDAAADRLMKSVKAGFRNFSTMQRDPDLVPLREHHVYRALLHARCAADDLLAQRNVNRWQGQLAGKGFAHSTDAAQRINYLTRLDEQALSTLQANVSDHLSRVEAVLFGSQVRQWVTLVLPDDLAEVDDHAPRRHVQGVYRHERRELIASDATVSLKHELVHMLHHRHMDELGQQHPIWIQEGLAALWEEYENLSDGSVRFTASERDAVAQTLLGHDRLIAWSELFTMSEAEFQREAHRTYAQVRSIFRFVASQHDLAGWYRRYTAHFDEDTTGTIAIERAFGESIVEVEQRWRQWLRSQPIVIDRRTPG